MSGKLFTQKSLVLNKGNNLVTLDVSSMAKGIYVLKIISNENEIAVEKWIKE
ncbi:MAG: T9SS type A sorting domain-containing protein [Ferruginibacter sp.]